MNFQDEIQLSFPIYHACLKDTSKPKVAGSIPTAVQQFSSLPGVNTCRVTSAKKLTTRVQETQVKDRCFVEDMDVDAWNILSGRRWDDIVRSEGSVVVMAEKIGEKCDCYCSHFEKEEKIQDI